MREARAEAAGEGGQGWGGEVGFSTLPSLHWPIWSLLSSALCCSTFTSPAHAVPAAWNALPFRGERVLSAVNQVVGVLLALSWRSTTHTSTVRALRACSKEAWLSLSNSVCAGERNGNPLQCSCLENPRDGGAWWAAVYGVAQSRT